MKEITPQVLAYLIEIPVKDAMMKIFIAKNKASKNPIPVHLFDKKEHKNISINIEKFKELTGIDCEMAIKSIRENYLKHPSTRDYIYDYPHKILHPVAKFKKTDDVREPKAKKRPNKITIPPVLQILLTDEQKEKIIQVWEERHQIYTKIGTSTPIPTVKFSKK